MDDMSTQCGMASITPCALECPESLQPSDRTTSSTSSEDTPTTFETSSVLDTTIVPNTEKKPKSYGSLTEQLHHVKTFIRKTIKDDKAGRLERKDLNRVSIAKMRLGFDKYDEILENLQQQKEKESSFTRERSLDSEDGNEDGGGDADKVTEDVSREELDIVSLRRQLANMRKRS